MFHSQERMEKVFAGISTELLAILATDGGDSGTGQAGASLQGTASPLQHCLGKAGECQHNSVHGGHSKLPLC